jgi:ferredoxin/flavodoxin---NADP+ reductase
VSEETAGAAVVDTNDVRVAIVGAGPAGLYAAEALLSAEAIGGIRVDVLDRNPTPFGLVRYGVAPDHLSIRSVRDTLDRGLDDQRLRFFGGVVVGEEDPSVPAAVSLADLRAHYDAVILAYGASTDRALGIEGEDLPGSISATEFVRWYTGHPDCPPDEFTDLVARARTVVVLGVGNVAVDVTRVLAKTRAELDHTDMPEHVLQALEASGVEQVYLIGRRGPAEASWTTKELKELGELAECAVEVAPGALPLTGSSESRVAESKVAARNVAVIEDWASRASRAAQRRITVRFFARPVRIIGDESVSAIEVETTELDDSGAAIGTGRTEVIPTDVVIRSVGYRGEGLADVPFDTRTGTVVHADGRVMAGEQIVPGLYVSGWIKRGPSGIIGTNKKDSVATVASLLADIGNGLLPRRPHDEDLFSAPHADVVSTAGWRRIDVAERALGSTRGRERTTIHGRGDAVAAAQESRG